MIGSSVRCAGISCQLLFLHPLPLPSTHSAPPHPIIYCTSRSQYSTSLRMLPSCSPSDLSGTGALSQQSDAVKAQAESAYSNQRMESAAVVSPTSLLPLQLQPSRVAMVGSLTSVAVGAQPARAVRPGKPPVSSTGSKKGASRFLFQSLIGTHFICPTFNC